MTSLGCGQAGRERGGQEPLIESLTDTTVDFFLLFHLVSVLINDTSRNFYLSSKLLEFLGQRRPGTGYSRCKGPEAHAEAWRVMEEPAGCDGVRAPT